MSIPPHRQALLGLDVGTVRIGVAVSDPEGRMAVPVTTVSRGRGDIDQLVTLAQERGVAGIVVGLPRTLRGGEGPAAQASRDFAVDLARRVAPTPVRLVDERFTTTSASQGLRDAGVGTRRARHVVDQVAATAILQAALDTTRSSGQPAGELVPAPPPAAPAGPASPAGPARATDDSAADETGTG
jgi:putative Holliday junction resolvase